ncbi:MAG: (2Fe-2S) ferredoxin domain-containing protein [Sedimentisphaeraceae bacterium JB056]
MTDKTNDIIDVTICMGSSCFSRGNKKTLSFIQEFIVTNGLDGKIKVTGSLCEGKCNCGPHITVNGNRYDNITAETAIDIIRGEMENN